MSFVWHINLSRPSSTMAKSMWNNIYFHEAKSLQKGICSAVLMCNERVRGQTQHLYIYSCRKYSNSLVFNLISCLINFFRNFFPHAIGLDHIACIAFSFIRSHSQRRKNILSTLFRWGDHLNNWGVKTIPWTLLSATSRFNYSIKSNEKINNFQHFCVRLVLWIIIICNVI